MKHETVERRLKGSFLILTICHISGNIESTKRQSAHCTRGVFIIFPYTKGCQKNASTYFQDLQRLLCCLFADMFRGTPCILKCTHYICTDIKCERRDEKEEIKPHQKMCRRTP